MAFKVTSGTAYWYRSSSGTVFDNSEIASSDLCPKGLGSLFGLLASGGKQHNDDNDMPDDAAVKKAGCPKLTLEPREVEDGILLGAGSLTSIPATSPGSQAGLVPSLDPSPEMFTRLFKDERWDGEARTAKPGQTVQLNSAVFSRWELDGEARANRVFLFSSASCGRLTL